MRLCASGRTRPNLPSNQLGIIDQPGAHPARQVCSQPLGDSQVLMEFIRT